MSCYSYSLKGRRDSQEDRKTIYENIEGKIKNKNKINLYAVYDGHGGTDVSKYLEQKLFKYFILSQINYADLNKLKSYIKKVYDILDSKLYSTLKDKAYKTGSTALVTILFVVIWLSAMCCVSIDPST